MKKNILKWKLLLIVTIMFSSLVFGQNHSVKGLVTDSENQPLLGVNVVEQGTSNGVITDFDGKYEINMLNPNGKLEFSYIGFKKIIVSVSNRNSINITLEPDVSSLDEVVVIGYGTARKKDLTGSVSQIKVDDFVNSSTNSVSDILQGRAAGVQVISNDGAPGGGVTIKIRGGNSLTGGSLPLYVIDGFPISPTDDPSFNPLGDINPRDIQSMEVLKDASATAIYGAEGANGVILITTKSGKEGKGVVSVSFSAGLAKLPGKIQMLNPEEFAYHMQGVYNSRYGSDPNYINPYDRKIEERIWETSATDYIDEITRTAFMKDLNVNFSGGSKEFKHSFSAGYLDQEGIVNRSGYKKMTARANLSHEIGKTKLGAILSISDSKYKGMINDWTQGNIITQALYLNPFIDKDDPLGNDLDEEIGFWDIQNPYTYINDVDFGKNFSKVTGKFYVDYKINDYLKFHTSVGQNVESRKIHRFYPSTTRKGAQSNGRGELENRTLTNWVYEARLNFNRTIGDHRIAAVGVFEAKGNKDENTNNSATQYADETLGIYGMNTSVEPTVTYNYISESSMVSGLARLNYGYKGKYLFTASLRADGSSKFGKDNKWGYFPSAAFAWNVMNEPFMENIKSISNLKLRTSYGVTGNNQIPVYQSLSLLSDTKYSFLDQVALGKFASRVANDDLKWETTSQYNVGLDIGLFDQRLSITTDLYYKKTTDLLLEVQLPTTSGFTTAIKNVGAIENKGLEFAFNSLNIDKEDFQWNTNFNIGFNRSKVLDLGEKNVMYFTRNFNHRIKNEIILKVGEPIGVYRGYVQDGVINSQEESFNAPISKIGSNAPGEVKFVDINKDGIIDNKDIVPLANTTPKHTGGMTNSFKYKNFDLNAFLNWSYGNDVINANIKYTTMTRSGNRVLSALNNNIWTPDNPERNYHNYMAQSHENVMRSEYVEDGSFLRLASISLGYTFPSRITNKLNMSNFRVYVTGKNLWLLTKYSWYDPEVNTGWGTAARVGPGTDAGSYPRSKDIAFGIEMNF